jgi:hypothetical protein
MKYIILKTKNGNRNYKYRLAETIEASSLEVAKDLLYKKLRREVNKKNGDTYIIIPYHKDIVFKNNEIPLEGVLYGVLQYREPGKGLH